MIAVFMYFAVSAIPTATGTTLPITLATTTTHTTVTTPFLVSTPTFRPTPTRGSTLPTGLFSSLLTIGTSLPATGLTVTRVTSISGISTSTRRLQSSGNPVTRNPGVNVSSIEVEPTYGPMAGGTVITIVASWTLPNVSISAVYFGSNLKTSNITSANNIASEVFVTSPPILDLSLINKPLPLTLQLSPGLVNVSSGKFFIYKPNPTIIDVYPRTIPLSGGIRLTVTGSNLASASHPVIRSSVIIARNNSLTSRNDSFGPCYQPKENGTQMNCLSPPIYIPQDFLLYLFGQTDQYSDVYRRRTRKDIFSIDWLKGHETPLTLWSRFKRSPGPSRFTNQTYTLPNSEDTMQIFLYADFDGSKVSLESVGNFKVVNSPTISCAETIYFDSKDSSTITIEGNGMSACCGKSDYSIRIGNGFCNVTDLNDNELKCEPPKDKPQQTENDKLYCGVNFAVFIYVGNKTYGCSCLTYADNSKTTLIIIIAATVGSSLAVFIVIVVISIFVRRSRTPRKQATQKESIRNPLAERRGVMMSRQPNDIGSLKSNATGSSVFSPEGYLNRLPMHDYITRPQNQSNAYLYQSQIDHGYLRAI